MKHVSYIYRIAEKIWDKNEDKYWRNVARLMMEALENDGKIVEDKEPKNGILRAPAFLSGVVAKEKTPIVTEYNRYKNGPAHKKTAYAHIRDCIDKKCTKSYHKTYKAVAREVAEDRAIGRV